MIKTICSGVNAFFTKDESASAIGLDQMETRLEAVFVIAMQGGPFQSAIVLDPVVQVAQIDLVDVSVIGDPGRANAVDQNLVHAVSGRCAVADLAPRNGIVQTEIVADQLDDLIKACAGCPMNLFVSIGIGERA